MSAEDPTAEKRARMVAEQIAARGVRSPDVLRTMQATPRHLFVPPDSRGLAYEDHPLPLGYGATISQPYIVALMTEAAAPAKTHRVLEIGTGSGYQAAVLAQLAARVYTIEIVPELARTAAKTLRDLGYANVEVRQGDGFRGWPEQAPFDSILLTAAPLEIPQTLIAQLAGGGRLVAPIGPLWRQELVLIEKHADGRLQRRSLGGVSFVPMRKK
jgi:protein-L-isoaspartate(D-aspartate) O-methyltransferase